jgi:hypothetical protein
MAASTTKGPSPTTLPTTSDLEVEEVPTLVESSISCGSKTGLLCNVPCYQSLMASQDNLVVDYTAPSKVEVAVCAVFFVASATFGIMSPIYPRERPIPTQYLEGSGDYVINLVYNEIFQGETIGTPGVLGLCAALPWIAQW